MRKRILSLITALSVVITSLPMLSLSARAEGNGTPNDPFLIYTADDLAAFRDTVNAGNVSYCAKLMNDINLSSVSNWVPIAQNEGYKGTFDGSRYTISGLKINTSTTDNIGLFGIISGGTVKNVAVSSANIVSTFTMTETTNSTIQIPEGYAKLTSRADWYAKHPDGIISTVGQTYSRSNTTKYNFYQARTYSGYGYDWLTKYVTPHGNASYTQYMNTASSVNVTTSYTKSDVQLTAGGIAAVLEKGTIDRCSFNGAVNTPYARAGGLVGWQKGGAISRSYSAGTVLGTYAGGAVGVIDGGTITDCYSTAISTAYTKTATIYSNANVQDYVTYTLGTRAAHVYTDYVFVSNGSASGSSTQRRDWSGTRCYGVQFHSYRFNSSNSNVTIHPGYTNGFACDVNGGTITNSYYYNKSAVNKAFTDNNSLAASTYTLATAHASSENSASLTAAEYTTQSNFTDWNFTNIWTMSDTLKRPVLIWNPGDEGVIPVLNPPEGDKAIITVIADNRKSTSANLADLVTVSSGESTAGRMRYSITEGEEYIVLYGDELIVKAPLSVGEYKVKLLGDDSYDVFDDFDVNLTIRAVKGIPAPEALNDGFKYSRERTLATVEITEGWQWVDPTIVPTNDPNEGYDAVFYFGENSPDLYDLSAIPTAVYDEVTNAVFMKVPVEVLASPESPWTTYITVLNADTDEIIEGASVYHTADYEFPLGHETGTDGRVYAELTAGKQTLTATKTGFEDLEAEVNIMATRGNEVTIKMKPARNMLKMPKVLLRDGAAVPKATVTVQKLSDNSTKEWEKGSVSAQYAAQSEQGLPIGEYRFTNATQGYTQTEAVYAKITEEDGIKLYSDAAYKNEITQDEFIIYVDLFSDPTYRVTIDRESETSTEYRADITLENIVATYGTFGIRYDPELFEFDPDDENSISFQNGLRLKLTPDDSYGTEWKNENGYVAFVWQPKGDSSATEFDATEQKAVARIKFKLKNVENADIITLDTFGVQAWNETPAAETFAATLKAHDNAFSPNEFFDDYWRYCDNENNAATLGIGRLAKVKAVVNGVDTGGFHQASVNAALGNTTENAYFYDIRTLLTYNFEVKGSVFKFHTVDKQTGENLSGTTLGLYGGEDEYYGAKKTDTYGRATYAVNEGDYTYTASLDGYWPIPLSGFSEDRPTATAETGRAKEVLVELEKKIYHVPEVINEELALNEDATVGGEKYGYNGRDFYFRIKAAPGYRITEYPKTAEVTVADTTVTLDVNTKNGVFRLGGEYLNQDPLTLEELLALDPSGTMPDENGFRSDNILIKFGDYTAEYIGCEVTAYTNENGIVSYAHTAGQLEATGGDHEKLIKTTQDNRETGTFTFTPAYEGYVVERVYINGLETDVYNGETTFDYSFGKVETDNNITVIYYDGTNKTDDTVLTLVVGDYGAANVTKPGAAVVQNTTKTYLNPQPSLEFTAVPMLGYELAGIDVSVNGGARTPVEIYRDDTEHNYVFEPPDTGQSKTVYVTFKDPEARNTPTVFVKAYVARGKGETDPAGILVYNLYDQPEFTLTASDKGKWLVDSVRVSPFEDTENYSVHEYEVKQTTNTYTLEPLKADTAMGAVFAEKGYVVKGKVDLSQGSNVTRAAPTTGAVVTFTREGTADAEEYKTKTTASRKDAVFTIEVPAGTWTVTVTKQGYVKYVITGFTFDAPEDETAVTWFGGDSEETAKKITPYIGSTQTGTSVSLLDAATVTAGMRTGVSGAQIARADADDDGEPNARDIAYVFFNYGVRTTRESYADFLASAQPDKPEIDV